MRRFTFPLVLLGLATTASFAAEESRTIASDQGEVTVHPIEHATFVLETADQRIAIDPVGGAERPNALEGVDLVLVTDIHGDHFDPGTLGMLAKQGASIVAPAAVAARVEDPELKASIAVLANGEKTTVADVTIEAIPMYNLTQSRDFHEKGRGNGYVIELAGLRIYVSGDTEDIPEMRKLENIDVAFVCMNLPYTMDVEQAADAVIDMNPRIVYPYHYRGTSGLSDVDRFAELVNAKADDIEVRQLDWYPEPTE